MRKLDDRLERLRDKARDGKLRVMILGLGSVGNYLLDYLLSLGREDVEVVVAGRNRAKMESDVNIAMVAATIRGVCRSHVVVADGVDLLDVNSVTRCLETYAPDIIVNSSRAYPGLKYGSISWGNVRAYGIWAPLAIRFVRNIMEAYEKAGCEAVIINTSYSDAVIPWMRSAGKAYPDFGSGNLNHLVPRIKFAVAKELGVDDFWNVDVTLVASHFHDVVISKEGQTEGVEPLVNVRYRGVPVDCDMTAIYGGCAIPMPVDAKRNMMNASSNLEIIKAILNAVCEGGSSRVLSPGAFGEIGGYPVIIDGKGRSVSARVDTSEFSLDEMRDVNRRSIYLDGIEDVRDGTLVYTDELVGKVEKAFGRRLPKAVPFDGIDDVAGFLVSEIIEPSLVCV